MSETVNMPKLGFDMAEGTLVRWVKKEGDSVNKGDVLAEIETDKATVEVESGFSGIVARQLVAEGSIVPIGTPIAIIAAPGEEIKDIPQADIPAKTTVTNSPETTQKITVAAKEVPVEAVLSNGPVIASPLAKKIAEVQNINLSLIKGSGPGGRIVKKDLENITPANKPEVLEGSIPLKTVESKRNIPVPVWNAVDASKDDQVLEVNRLRSIIGRRMTEAKQQVPHFYITHEYDVAGLLDLRKQINAQLSDEQKLSVNDFIIKASALTLRQFPNINASLNADKIIRHGHINIGVAVSLENGLMTVVCKDADLKPVRLISSEVKEMVANARTGKIKTEYIEGATFSISNLGMYQVEEFVAIINPPEAAILAVGSAKETPVVKNGALAVGMHMKMTISCDHRITDGVEAARFMQTMAGFLETPIQLMS